MICPDTIRRPKSDTRKKAPTACLAEKSTNRTTHQINANYPGSNTRSRKRALTLTFLVKPQGEPYPTDSGSVPLRFQGRVKPCASNHTLETKQRPPPQRHTELPHPQRLPSDRHSPRRPPSRKQNGVPYRHSAPLSNIWLLMFYHPFFVAPVLTAALFAPEVLGAGLATGLGAAVFAGAFFAEVF